jgi:hypothetical protein
MTSYLPADNAPDVLREDFPDQKHLVFVHSAIDEAGLSVSEFRVYCHLARRGTCFSTVGSIADTCKLCINTVWSALKALEDRKMIRRQHRTGLTTVITLTHPSAWTPTPKNGVPQSTTHPKIEGETHPKIGGDHPPQNRGHKGNPYEVYPIKGGGEQKPPPQNRIAEVAEMHATFCRESGEKFNQIANERHWLGLVNHGYTPDDVALVVRFNKHRNSQNEDPNYHRAITIPSLCADDSRFDADLVQARGWHRNRRLPPTARENALQDLRPHVDHELEKARLNPARSAQEVSQEVIQKMINAEKERLRSQGIRVP